jgi:type II secretory pathway pseudopilin PulG
MFFQNKHNPKQQKGFSVIEVIIALGISTIIVSGIIGLLVQSMKYTRWSEHRWQATSYAAGAIEAVINIKDNDWSTVAAYATDGTVYRLTTGGGQWQLVPDAGGETLGIYTRLITFSQVCRDGANAIAPCGGGNTPDPDSRKITVTMNWTEAEGNSRSLQLEQYLMNWPVCYARWPYIFGSQYDYDTNKIEVTGGQAGLIDRTAEVIPNGNFATGDFTSWDTSGNAWEVVSDSGNFVASTENNPDRVGVISNQNTFTSAGQQLRFRHRGYGQAVFLWDDFQDGSASDWLHTWDTGTNWNVVNDGGNYVYRYNNAAYSQTQRGSTAWDDYTLTAKFRPNAYNQHGIVFRYQDDNNFWRLIFENNEVRVRGRVGGAWVDAGGSGGESFTPTAGQWYQVKITVTGDSLKAKYWSDGNPEPGVWNFDLTDNALLAGAVGLAAQGSTDFDDVKVIYEGANPEYNNYVALMRASNHEQLLRVNAPNSGDWQDVIWDLSAYANESVYLNVVDNSTDVVNGWYAVDDFRQTDSEGNGIEGYAANRPAITPNESHNITALTNWYSFAGDNSGTGTVYYQLSNDNGATWYYWNSLAWAPAGPADYSLASDVNNNIFSFPLGNYISVRAFLASNGAQPVYLDEVIVAYEGECGI